MRSWRRKRRRRRRRRRIDEENQRGGGICRHISIAIGSRQARPGEARQVELGGDDIGTSTKRIRLRNMEKVLTVGIGRALEENSKNSK